MTKRMIHGLEAFIDSWNDDHEEERVPTTNILCPICNGEGTQALHGYDVTEMIAEDPDFGEDYFNGHYDTVCDYCQGSKVLLSIDYDSASKEMTDEWTEWVNGIAEDLAIQAAERAAGC